MSDKIVQLDDNNFQEVAEQGVVLVDFFAEWCGPCRMLTPVLEQLAVKLEGKAKIGKLDMDHSQKVTSQFEVTSVPTIVVLNNGKEVERVVGLRDLETLEGMVSSLL